MKYAILALGLLVTPVVAETYTRIECSFIENMLDNCTVKPDCKPIVYPVGVQAEPMGSWWRRMQSGTATSSMACVSKCATANPRRSMRCTSIAQ
jgi:hypothetical protein